MKQVASKKNKLSAANIEIVVNLLNKVKPHQANADGDLDDPHRAHRVCLEAISKHFNRQSPNHGEMIVTYGYTGMHGMNGL